MDRSYGAIARAMGDSRIRVLNICGAEAEGKIRWAGRGRRPTRMGPRLGGGGGRAPGDRRQDREGMGRQG